MAKPKYSTVILATCLAGFLVGLPAVSQADPRDQLLETERKLAEKSSGVRTLADELAVLEATAQAKATYLAQLEAERTQTRRDLAKLNGELERAQRDRQSAERNLTRYVAADYVEGSPNAYFVLASAKSLAESVSLQTYLGQLQSAADDVADQMRVDEAGIAKRQERAQKSYVRLDELEESTSKETGELVAVRLAKQRLLGETAGQEDAFRKKFEAAREQLKKTGQYARSARERLGSRVWDESGGYFNQLDSRWIDEKLGFSDSSTIGDYGCGVAALAMVYKHYGLQTNPSLLNGDLKRTGALFDDLLEWPNTTAASGGRLTLVGSTSLFERGRADWNLINSQLDTGNPVIVYIDRPGKISHYVVLTARRGSGYLMHDPIEGPNLRFEDYYQTDWVYQTITYRRS